MAEKTSNLSPRGFLKSALKAGAGYLLKEAMEKKTLFPEDLKPTLEGWMGNKDYDRDPLKPLAAYAKHLHETSLNRGWIALENEVSTKVWVGESEAPELLQEQGTILFKNNKDEVRGFIWNDYATLSVQGRGGAEVEGTLDQFSGGVIENYEGTYEAKISIPSDTPIPFKIVWRGSNQFQGWIYFRGHRRKFGGGATRADFPKILMWRGDK